MTNHDDVTIRDEADPGPSRGYRAAVSAREVLLWIGAAVGVACLVAAAAAMFFGLTPLVFRSGSMSPVIPTGAIALAQKVPVGDLRAGDIVSVIRGDGERVTHRLVSMSPADGESLSLVIKGDANAEADPEPIVARTADRVFWSVPKLGFVIQGASRPHVLLPVGALFGILAAIGFRPPIDRRRLRSLFSVTPSVTPETESETEPGSAPARHRAPARGGAPSRGAALALVAALVVAGSAGGLHGTTTLAAFADTGAGAAPLAAGTVASPATFTCTIVSGQVRFNWTVAPAPTWAPASFVVTNTTSGSTTTVSDAAARSVDVSPPTVSLGGLTTFVYTITARLGTQSSTSGQTRSVVAVLGMAPTCS